MKTENRITAEQIRGAFEKRFPKERLKNVSTMKSVAEIIWDEAIEWMQQLSSPQEVKPVKSDDEILKTLLQVNTIVGNLFKMHKDTDTNNRIDRDLLYCNKIIVEALKKHEEFASQQPQQSETEGQMSEEEFQKTFGGLAEFINDKDTLHWYYDLIKLYGKPQQSDAEYELCSKVAELNAKLIEAEKSRQSDVVEQIIEFEEWIKEHTHMPVIYKGRGEKGRGELYQLFKLNSK